MEEVVTGAIVAKVREAGRGWAARDLVERLRVIARARRLIALEAPALAATVARPVADTLAAEVLPLADAAQFLLRAAPGLLRPRRVRRGRPLWLLGVRAEIRREPRGAVLILGPGNYPLFLPGAQALQALVAGNGICIKPAPGAAAPMLAFAALLRRAGLPEGVLTLLDEGAGQEAATAGFDLIVLTGGAPTGVRVLHEAAETLTPSVMELSGSDAVFVLPGADLAVVAAALAYGLRLNGGATCIAPRRVFVPDRLAGEVIAALCARLPPPAAIPEPVGARLSALLDAAERDGARVLCRNPGILTDARPDMRLLQEDVFAPWLAFVKVASPEAALAAAAVCPFALGASIFGPAAEARELATRLRAGSVCINDLIVPTADPRLPFGGRGRSGFGVTRGAEGLLEMTVPKTISTCAGRFRPHLDPALVADAGKLLGLIRLLHGGWAEKWAALRSLR